MIELVFQDGVSAQHVDEALFPPDGGHNISVSSESPGINRHDVTAISRGRDIIVRIDGVKESDMSSSTLQSIKDTVPTDHIQTRDVE
jgi:hypothetical protein